MKEKKLQKNFANCLLLSPDVKTKRFNSKFKQFQNNKIFCFNSNNVSTVAFKNNKKENDILLLNKCDISSSIKKLRRAKCIREENGILKFIEKQNFDNLEIKKEIKKVSFCDNIENKSKLVEIIDVESYKKYNISDNDDTSNENGCCNII